MITLPPMMSRTRLVPARRLLVVPGCGAGVPAPRLGRRGVGPGHAAAPASAGEFAGHHEAEDVARRVPRHDSDDPAAVHHRDAVGERRDLVELGRDDDHRHARVARLDDALVDELDRADVESAGRLRGDEQPQLAAQLAGEHDLLRVAAGEPADLRVDGLGAHVELAHLLRRRTPSR